MEPYFWNTLYISENTLYIGLGTGLEHIVGLEALKILALEWEMLKNACDLTSILNKSSWSYLDFWGQPGFLGPTGGARALEQTRFQDLNSAELSFCS